MLSNVRAVHIAEKLVRVGHWPTVEIKDLSGSVKISIYIVNPVCSSFERKAARTYVKNCPPGIVLIIGQPLVLPPLTIGIVFDGSNDDRRIAMKIWQFRDGKTDTLQDIKEAFRSGLDGVIAQEKIYTKKWGFDLGKISPKLQVYVWHGDMDVFVPSSFGHKFCEAIPNCKGFFYAEEGHLSLTINHLDEILKTLIS